MSRKGLRIDMADPVASFTNGTSRLLKPRETLVSSKSPGHEERMRLYEERAANNIGLFDGVEMSVDCIDESQRTMFETDEPVDGYEPCEPEDVEEPEEPDEFDDLAGSADPYDSDPCDSE